MTHLGSAHTRGDVLVHVPVDRVLYTGDLLFVGGHPVIWAGPVENCIKACDYILSLDVEIIVPGHGPIADKAAVRELRSYFEYITGQAQMHFDNGLPYEEAARKISLDRFAGWLDPERIIINVATLYRQFSGPQAAAVDRGTVRWDEAIPRCNGFLQAPELMQGIAAISAAPASSACGATAGHALKTTRTVRKAICNAWQCRQLVERAQRAY